MRIKLELQGMTPLVLHNERLSIASDPITKQIATLTAKKTNRTESDDELISRLEWYGGLYVDADGNVIMPTQNIARCFVDAGTVTRSGTKVARGLAPYELSSPLIIPGGERHQDALWKKPEHALRRPVGIGRNRVLRTRPIFPRWGVRADFEVLEDVLNFDEFVEVAERAGRAIGLCDGRRIGYGRFSATVQKA